jgi:glycosyltransferase involved in cell wall biosynthesis
MPDRRMTLNLRDNHKKKLSIIVPALNEEDGIENTIGAIPKEALERLNFETQVIVVDNDSHDGTGDLARRAGAEVIFEAKRGYGRALKAGFHHASGDLIATADADASYPVEDIPRLVGILEEEGLDFVTTDRFSLLEKGVMTFRNRVGNRILTLAMRCLFRLDIKDSQSGMWVFRRSLLDTVVLRSNGMALSEELKIEACHFSGARWKEIPIRYRARLGEVKLRGWRDGLGNLLSLVRKRIAR